MTNRSAWYAPLVGLFWSVVFGLICGNIEDAPAEHAEGHAGILVPHIESGRVPSADGL